jgi:hypothetical protein
VRLRIFLMVAATALSLGACSTIDDLPRQMGLPERGFLTHAFDDEAADPDDAPVAANGCTEAGCPQAPTFCTARGYTPGSDGYQRCLISVRQNLRQAH